MENLDFIRVPIMTWENSSNLWPPSKPEMLAVDPEGRLVWLQRLARRVLVRLGRYAPPEEHPLPPAGRESCRAVELSYENFRTLLQRFDYVETLTRYRAHYGDEDFFWVVGTPTLAALDEEAWESVRLSIFATTPVVFNDPLMLAGFTTFKGRAILIHPMIDGFFPVPIRDVRDLLETLRRRP